VRRIVADILEIGKQWRAVSARRHSPETREQILELEARLRELMRELERIGCYYKDWGFDMGLIDFPARIDGRPVFLCWRSDEEEICWYHAMNEGYASRQPIPPEELG
jgi:hypothetical protein